jgi:RimJ/RimL family protein N-acetyltransferase
MNLEFWPIHESIEDNVLFSSHPDCSISLQQSIDFFQRVGYALPWIGYYVKREDEFVGVGAFKGRPVNGRVEIAYGTFDNFRSQGIATLICRMLVELSLRTDSSVRVCARTLMEENHSVMLLRKNGFEFKGVVVDPEDGDVWEWEYAGDKKDAGVKT